MADDRVVIHGNGMVVGALTTDNFIFGANTRPALNASIGPPTNPNASPRVNARAFLSYAVEHEDLAKFFGTFVANSFPELKPVFLAGSPSSIPAGTDWFAEIIAALRSAQVLFVLANETSLARRWVNFEIGAAWAREIPIVFLCYGDMTPASLPTPYSNRQSLLLTPDDTEAGLISFIEHMKHALAVEPNQNLPVALFAEHLAKQLKDTLE